MSEEIIRMIEEAKRVDVPISGETNLRLDLGFNSLSFIQFLMKIEEAFSITFGIAEIETCLQVDRLIALVENKLGERKNCD